MNAKEKPEFVELVAALAATFGREADKPMYVGYWLGLNDLSLDSIRTAATMAMRQNKFMPTVAELREFAGDMRTEDRAAISFQALSRAVARFGYYNSVNFDDPVINAAVRNLGGWERVSSIESIEEWEKWFRKDFERVYVSLARSGIDPDDAAPLLGFCDRDNIARGYLVDRQLRLLDGATQPQKIESVVTGLPPHLKPIVRPGIGRQAGRCVTSDLPRLNFPRPEDAA